MITGMKFGMAAVASVIPACNGNSSFSDSQPGRACATLTHPTTELITSETRNNQEATRRTLFSRIFLWFLWRNV